MGQGGGGVGGLREGLPPPERLTEGGFQMGFLGGERERKQLVKC